MPDKFEYEVLKLFKDLDIEALLSYPAGEPYSALSYPAGEPYSAKISNPNLTVILIPGHGDTGVIHVYTNYEFYSIPYVENKTDGILEFIRFLVCILHNKPVFPDT